MDSVYRCPEYSCVRIDLYRIFENLARDYNNRYSSDESSDSITDYLGLCHFQDDGTILVPEFFYQLYSVKSIRESSISLRMNSESFDLVESKIKDQISRNLSRQIQEISQSR